MFLAKIWAYIVDRVKNPSKIVGDVAWLGQQIQFVAFMAHAFTGGYIISHLSHSWKVRLVLGLILDAAGAVKEFYFDARYEKNPPQTFNDNLQDFLGWVAASILGVIG